MVTSRRRADDGFTLAELSVTMIIFGVLVLVLAQFSTQAFRLYGANANRITSGGRASLVMEQVSKDLRTAVAITVLSPPAPSSSQAFAKATGTEVKFYSSVSGGPVQERLYVVGTQLWRETILPDLTSSAPAYTYTTNRALQTRLLSDRVVTGSAPFSYLLRGSLLPPAAPVAPVDLGAIVGVQILVTINADASGRTRATQLQNTVRPYNVT